MTRITPATVAIRTTAATATRRWWAMAAALGAISLGMPWRASKYYLC